MDDDKPTPGQADYLRSLLTVGAALAHMSAQPEAERPKRWIGEVPTHCDLCKKPLIAGWVDGATTLGPWGNMCVKREDGNRSCFQMYGRGLGTGVGQQYDATGVKVAG